MTNLKPNSWYEKYLKVDSYLDTIEELKQLDIMADNNKSADKISGFLQFEEKNNLGKNKKILKKYKSELGKLPLCQEINNPLDIESGAEQYCIQQTKLKINLCFEALEQEYLITAQLEDISIEIDDYWYNEESTKPILDTFKQFKFENYQQELFNFIKINSNWYNKDRDFEIYQEIQKGKLYSEIAGRLGCDISNISKINKKIQSSINNLKGKLFEIEYEKYLKSLNKFQIDKIVRDGDPGKPDIYINDIRNNALYVLSLKNLEINKKSYCITKEQLKPELEFAYYNNTFEDYKKVFLYLIVFDSSTEKLKK